MDSEVLAARTMRSVGFRPARKWRVIRVSLATLHYLMVLAGAGFLLVPLAWMISTSLKDQIGAMAFPPRFIPDQFLWQNYKDVATLMPLATYMKNTALITALTIAGTTWSNSWVAYGFAKLRSRSRSFLFIVLLSTTMLPGQVTIIPLYKMFVNMGWLDTFKPLVVPAFFGSAFTVFLVRQFYVTIPNQILESGRIDGCSELRLYWQIMLPLSKPILVTIAVFAFMGAWNDLFGPLIYISSDEKKTLALGIMMLKGMYNTEWHYLMALSLIAMLPCIIVFYFAQRYYLEGIVLGAVKG
ncbi:MAG: carbohydrate ABC transporter permease [Firmicutes bacterium]|nr:carbohydrate ABC transporter permease [Bacillota bacterium]